MAKQDRTARRRSFGPETLETRNLLSTLIGSKPTLDAFDARGVFHNRFGGISITQPAVIRVFGTAQPGPPGSTVQVGIFAEDSQGNIVNGGQPLAVATPNSLGRYQATVTLPSRIRADVNFLVARQTASAVETFGLVIDPTTLSGLNGTLGLAPGTLSGLTGDVANPTNTISNLTGTIGTPGNSLTGFGASFMTTATPIGGLGGTITLPSFPVNLATTATSTGTLTGTTDTGGTPGTIDATSAGTSTGTAIGTAGPVTGTFAGGTGTLGGQSGTISGGTGAIGATSGTLSGGTGTIGATTSTLTQTGTAVESGRTGTFTQSGTAAIAGTTGTASRLAQEVATSDPLVVLIHQPRGVGAARSRTAARIPRVTGVVHPVASSVGHAAAIRAARARDRG